MAELSARASAADERRRYLAFRIGDRLHAVEAQAVAEIVRTPVLARVPQAPASLLGLANLRGSITPVASLRGLLGGAPETHSAGEIALLLAGDAPVAIVVGSVPSLVTVDAIDTDEAALLARPEEEVRGVFSIESGEVARIIDVHALLKRAFTPRAVAQRERQGRSGPRAGENGRNDDVVEERYISFIVADQEFALELDAVREIIMAPEVVSPIPHAEDLVIGVTAYRETLLPLLSLRGLLGLPRDDAQPAAKVVVSHIGGALVGLVADRAKAIVSVGPGESDPPPTILAARTGGESQIKAIYRGDQGRRLVSILSPEALFREDVMQRLAQAQPSRGRVRAEQDAVEIAQEHYVVFRLGDDEFALSIEAVIEVARVPQQITRVPKAPAFLEGVVSFRGEVLPVVDQRRRFDMAVLEGDTSRRLIMVRSERHRAGLIVDAVSEVLSHPRGMMDPAPDLTGDQTRLVLGVINLEEAARMVMVLDPAELLSRAERGLLDAFAAELPQAQ